ncbi:MAG: biotin--[acetyl-CoA-carboxylase] ligase [Desulfobulbaceae bacterium]|nr:MAG: biotin--[acetyl-CoA-carboxylase] ligase [Desulfobulbaceae bacterium]
MGVSPLPDPNLLASYIAREEGPRLAANTPLPAADILRYGAIVGCHIEAHASLPRAMDEMRRRIVAAGRRQQSLASGSVIIADTLTGSKGRFRRVWHAPPGGLWLVVALFNQWLPATAQLLPLAAGLAACETVRHFGLEAEVKWVNDVLVNGRKVCGILCETFCCPLSREEYILVGVGLNVNNSRFPADLAPLATSMKSAAGRHFDRGEVALDLLSKLRWNVGLLTYEEEERHSDHDIFMESYRALSTRCGRMVSFGFNVQEQPQYQARVKAIADDGALVLELEQDGVERVEHAGEIIYLDET